VEAKARQVVGALHPHPKLRTRAEQLTKPHRHVRADRRMPIADARRCGSCHADSTCGFGQGHFAEIVVEQSAWCDGSNIALISQPL